MDIQQAYAVGEISGLFDGYRFLLIERTRPEDVTIE